jgi:hypothetical protein
MSIELLLPVLVGIVAAKRIHPIWNFLLMNFVFQLVAEAVVFPARGFRPFLLIAPYVISFIVPCIVGALAAPRFGQFATFVVIICTFYVWGVLLVLVMDGQFQPVRFVGGLFLSPGALVPPLVFVLVSMLAGKRYASNAAAQHL